MSIGRRFLNIARSELNSLLDFAAKRWDGDGDGGDNDGDRDGAYHGGESLHGYSASELQEELDRRRSARQEVEDAIHGKRTPDAPPRPAAGGAGSTTSPRGEWRPPGAPPTGRQALSIQKAYAALEVNVGADFVTVRKAYRGLMRKYHPDHHTESAEKQRAANEVAQRLTEAYKLLEKTLRK
jgi:DnaJ-domain-containing protein 1